MRILFEHKMLCGMKLADVHTVREVTDIAASDTQTSFYLKDSSVTCLRCTDWYDADTYIVLNKFDAASLMNRLCAENYVRISDFHVIWVAIGPLESTMKEYPNLWGEGDNHGSVC